jgi:hypothetical protein
LDRMDLPLSDYERLLNDQRRIVVRLRTVGRWEVGYGKHRQIRKTETRSNCGAI